MTDDKLQVKRKTLRDILTDATNFQEVLDNINEKWDIIERYLHVSEQDSVHFVIFEGKLQVDHDYFIKLEIKLSFRTFEGSACALFLITDITDRD